MAPTTVYGYDERPYLNTQDPYLTGIAANIGGMQANYVINHAIPQGMQAAEFVHDKTRPYGMQATFKIVDHLREYGMQATFTIAHQNKFGMQAGYLNSVSHASGMQSNFTIKPKNPYAMQALFTIKPTHAYGMQVSQTVKDKLKEIGMQAAQHIADHLRQFGMQANFVIKKQNEFGMQALFKIKDKQKQFGMQAAYHIVDHLTRKGMEVRYDKYPTHLCSEGGYLEGPYLGDPYLTNIFCMMPGMQSNFVLNKQLDTGMQADYTIKKSVHKGMQSEFVVKISTRRGMQVDFTKALSLGMQALATIYNVTNLRVLSEFPSRGVKTGTGTNTWGNPVASGQNWRSNSTEAGDFSPFNLNTDVVEQYWRSATGVTSGIRLDCDTELTQGVFTDTLGILNANLTRSANVVFIGSNTSDFSVVGSATPLVVTQDNTYWVAPTLPLVGFRYWRLQIDDPTNPDGFVRIGTVVFGPAQIFQGEQMVDQLDFQLKDFTDTVRTAGHTNVTNSRAQKRTLKLDFESLQFSRRNFKILRNIFVDARTILKCLWIPTPSTTDTDVLNRFTVFAKLVQVPSERHNNKGDDADYVTLTIDLDESL